MSGHFLINWIWLCPSKKKKKKNGRLVGKRMSCAISNDLLPSIFPASCFLKAGNPGGKLTLTSVRSSFVFFSSLAQPEISFRGGVGGSINQNWPYHPPPPQTHTQSGWVLFAHLINRSLCRIVWFWKPSPFFFFFFHHFSYRNH